MECPLRAALAPSPPCPTTPGPRLEVGMATFNDKIAHQWRDAANLVLGIWLALSPAALSYMEHTTPAANGSLVGIVIAVAAIQMLGAVAAPTIPAVSGTNASE